MLTLASSFSLAAFNAPAMGVGPALGAQRIEAVTFVPKYDEIGVMPPLGRWDPLQIREQGPERYRRFVEMEIKHGRMSMAAVTGVLVTYSGLRWPGYLSTAE